MTDLSRSLRIRPIAALVEFRDSHSWGLEVTDFQNLPDPGRPMRWGGADETNTESIEYGFNMFQGDSQPTT
jgi:hypothetical protein